MVKSLIKLAIVDKLRRQYKRAISILRPKKTLHTHRDDVLALIERYKQAGVSIGQDCYVWNVNLSFGDPISIGHHCVLTGCTILGHDASPALFIEELSPGGPFERRSLFRPTVIHDRVFIGVGAIVLCGRTVGPNSIVAAGAVVTHDVPSNMVVAGNPAKVVGTLKDFVDKHRKQLMNNPDWYEHRY